VGCSVRVAIVTAYARAHAALIPVTLPSLAAHAERHGHDIVLAGLVPGVHFDHSKIAALMLALDSHETAIWIDCDSIIRPDALDIARITDEPMALQWDPVHDGYASQLMAARRDAIGTLELVWQARCERTLDDASGVLQEVLGFPDADGVHWLHHNGQVATREQYSERLGPLGVIHAGSHGGSAATAARLRQAAAPGTVLWR
jgi:hypothetical protein